MWIKKSFSFSAFVPGIIAAGVYAFLPSSVFCAADRENEDKENIMLYENMIILGEYWEISWSFIR